MATPRWEKDAGEVFGRGPGWNALSSQKMLNEIKKVTLKAGQKAIDPPLMIDSEGVLGGDVRTHPGSLIPINSVMSMMNPPIQPLPFGGNFNIGVELIQDTREAVQNSFHHQLIELLKDPRMTATQVLELSEQMQRHLAPILGRMQTELLEPTVERVFAIESRAGRLPPPPPDIVDKPIKIDYVNPIARAQQSSSARAFIDFSNVAVGLQQADPDVEHLVDYTEGLRKLAESLGVSPTVLRNRQEIEQRKAAARELAAQQAAEQQAVTATDQIAKLAKAMPQQQGAA